MKIAAIIQARFGSTRLPGKIFLELCGKPMLQHVVDRLKYSKRITDIVVATTIHKEDDKVQQFCEQNNILFYRGSSEDVLSRYYEAAKKINTDIIIRITSDCPLIDPVVLDKMIDEYIKINKTQKLDYLSNTIERTFPRGLDTEIFLFNVLEKAYNEATELPEREHVTPYIYKHPELFALKNFINEKDFSFYRWTVDTIEDFQLIETIYNELYNPGKIFLLKDVLNLFEKKPELMKINQNISQKSLGE